MDEYILKKKISSLHKRQDTKLSKTNFSLYYKLTHNYAISSFEEALEYLVNVVKNKNINPDDLMNQCINYITFDPVFLANTVDESITKIIFIAYQCISYRNYDYLEYMNRKLIEIFDSIKDNHVCKYIVSLSEIMIKLINLTSHTYKEEYNSNELAKSYYEMMYCIYDILDRNNDDIYFLNMKNKYKEFL